MSKPKVDRGTVFIHSFHSQVADTLGDLETPDVLICFDSHLDIRFGTWDVMSLMPDDIRLAAGRASTHTLIRRATGEIPLLRKAADKEADFNAEMTVVISSAAYKSHLAYLLYGSSSETGLVDLVGESKAYDLAESFMGTMRRLYGMEVYLCPPKPIHRLISSLKEEAYDQCTVDLDVDYLSECQTECYTPVKGEVDKLIRKLRPNLITISEATVEALQDSTSNIYKFVSTLQSLGYEIDKDAVFESDIRAKTAMQEFEKFDREIQGTIRNSSARKQLTEGKFDEVGQQELEKKTREYFSKLRGEEA